LNLDSHSGVGIAINKRNSKMHGQELVSLIDTTSQENTRARHMITRNIIQKMGQG
jgi:hypothetical protein